MLSAVISRGLNSQLNLEYRSSWLYRSMYAWSSLRCMMGFTSWLKRQAEEERQHGQKIFDYLTEQNSAVHLETIPEPKAEWESFKELFEDVLKHEETVTQSITHLYEEASQNKDYATRIFLQWFITEQVEEVSEVRNILQLLDDSGQERDYIYFANLELEKRAL